MQEKDMTDSTYDQLLKARGLDKKPKRSLHFQYKRDVILPDKYKTKKVGRDSTKVRAIN